MRGVVAGSSSGRFEREIRRVVAGGVLFLLFLSGLSVVVLRNLAAWAESEYRNRISGGTRIVAERLGSLDDSALALTSAPSVADLLRTLGARGAAVYDEEGSLLAEAAFLAEGITAPKRIPERVPPGDVQMGRLTRDGSTVVPTACSFRGGTRTLRLVFDGTSLAMARRNVRIISIAVPASALTLGILVVPFLRRMLRPIDALTQAARGAGPLVDPGGAASLLVRGRSGPDEPEQAIATFIRTIEELKRSSREIEELRHREKERADALAMTADTLVRSHPGGVLMIDKEGRLSDANTPALEALDLSPRELELPAVEVLAPFPPLVEALARASRGLATLGARFTLGELTEQRLLAITAVPVVNAKGSPLGTLVFLEDRTLTSHLERELSRRRELAALGEMSAGIAHEFRNATATILGYVRLAAATGVEEDRARHLRAIRDEAEHVARVTGDFLFFARPERVALVATRLRPLVEEIVEEEVLSAPSASFELHGAFGTALIDTPLFRRALVNLLRNAQEASCVAGRAGRVLVRGDEGAGGAAWISVEDDGAGIDSGSLPKLFVPFYSTKEAGTGLGLALVAKIAALHGGSVGAERSAALGGARFVLRFPPVSG